MIAIQPVTPANIPEQPSTHMITVAIIAVIFVAQFEKSEHTLGRIRTTIMLPITGRNVPAVVTKPRKEHITILRHYQAPVTI